MDNSNPVPLLSMELARRIELVEAASAADYAAIQAQLAPATQAVALAIQPGPAQVVFAGPGSPVSRAIGLGMAGPVQAAVIELVEGFFRRRGEHARIDCCPVADPSLADLLATRGYVLVGFKQVMVLPLPELTGWSPCAGTMRHPDQEQIDVTTVTREQGELWVDTISRGFSHSESGPNESDRAIARPSLGRTGASCLLAWIGGVPVGGGVVELRDGVALLRSQSTLPQYRGRGVQAAVVWQSLRHAIESGCDLAMVQAVPGSQSQRNLERAGFRTIYTKPTLAGPAGQLGRESK